MKRLFELMLVALFAVGLAVSYQSYAAWSTFKPPVTNDFTKHYFQELRGYKLVYGLATTAAATSSVTVTGMETGDVIVDIVNHSAIGVTVENIDESIYTAGAGVATLNTSGGAPTSGDSLVFLFVDVDNTN
jgi:hypothetical protein